MGDDTSAGADRRLTPWPIIDPSRERAAARRAAGEQFGAAIAEALAVGFAQSLANQLRKLTMTEGPWTLDGAGRVHEADERTSALVMVASELYRLLLGEYDTADDEDWKRDALVVLDAAHDLLWPGGDT